MSKVKRRPNIFDLEKATGLSRGTISRAFNNVGGISATTREMILRKASEIGYSPHPGARTIKIGRTGRWGLLVPNVANPWYGELTEAFDAASRQRNSMLLLGLSHYDPNLERKFIRYWASGEADGIIAASTDMDDAYEDYARIQATGFPLVFLYSSPKTSFDYVSFNVRDNFERALRQLYAMGHRRIAYVSKAYNHARDNPCFCGYLDFHKEHDLSVKEEYLHFIQNDYDAGPETWRQWQTLAVRPTAAICTGDVMACSLIQMALGAGLRVPQDLSVIGLNDIAEAARLKLTTIRTDRNAMASAVFDLLERSRGPEHPKMVAKSLESELILRDSIGVCPITTNHTASVR